MVSLPDLFLPKIRFFGLAIESRSLCGIEVNEKRVPIRSAQIQLPEGTIVGGQLQRVDVFTQALHQLCKSGGFSTPYVAVTFPESLAFTRGLTVPTAAGEDINEAITWQAKDLFPFPQHEIYFDSKVLSQMSDESHVTVVAVQRKHLDPFIQGLEAVGLKPLRFEPDAMALSRLLGLRADQQAVLVERNSEGAYVTLVAGDKSVFTTIVPKSATETDTDVEKHTTSTLSEIVKFYQGRGQLGATTTTIVVTGEPISQAWVGEVARMLGFPAKILKTQFGKSVCDKAYAAVLYPIQPPSNILSINLLPLATQQFYDEERHQAFFKALFVRAIAIPLIFCFIAGSVYLAIQLERGRLEARVSELNKIISSQQTDMKKLLLVNNQAKTVVALAPLRKTPREYLAELSQLVEEDIMLNSWTYEDESLRFQITGTAKTRSALLSFKDRLEESKLFTKITVPLGTLETPINVPFTMTFITEK